MVVGTRLRRLALTGVLCGTGLFVPCAASLAASPFDGTYVGTQRETANNNS